MLFKTLEGSREENIFLNQYKIDWDGPSASKFQWRVKQFFKKYFGDLEWFEEVALPGMLSQLRIDFLCRFKENGKVKLVFIESDGNFHIKKNNHFHPTDEDYICSSERDSAKYLYCEKNKIPLLRIYEDDDLTIEWFNTTFNYPLPVF